MLVWGLRLVLFMSLWQFRKEIIISTFTEHNTAYNHDICLHICHFIKKNLFCSIENAIEYF